MGGLFVCQFQNDFDSRENPTDASVDNDPIRMLRVPGMVALLDDLCRIGVYQCANLFNIGRIYEKNICLNNKPNSCVIGARGWKMICDYAMVIS